MKMLWSLLFLTVSFNALGAKIEKADHTINQLLLCSKNILLSKKGGDGILNESITYLEKIEQNDQDEVLMELELRRCKQSLAVLMQIKLEKHKKEQWRAYISHKILYNFEFSQTVSKGVHSVLKMWINTNAQCQVVGAKAYAGIIEAGFLTGVCDLPSGERFLVAIPNVGWGIGLAAGVTTNFGLCNLDMDKTFTTDQPFVLGLGIMVSTSIGGKACTKGVGVGIGAIQLEEMMIKIKLIKLKTNWAEARYYLSVNSIE